VGRKSFQKPKKKRNWVRGGGTLRADQGGERAKQKK